MEEKKEPLGTLAFVAVVVLGLLWAWGSCAHRSRIDALDERIESLRVFVREETQRLDDKKAPQCCYCDGTGEVTSRGVAIVNKRFADVTTRETCSICNGTGAMHSGKRVPEANRWYQGGSLTIIGGR